MKTMDACINLKFSAHCQESSYTKVWEKSNFDEMDLFFKKLKSKIWHLYFLIMIRQAAWKHLILLVQIPVQCLKYFLKISFNNIFVA